MQAMIGERVKKVKGLLKAEKLDAILVSNFYNRLYISGLSFFSLMEREAFLIITQKTNYILTYQMYAEPVQKTLKGFEIKIINRDTPLKKILNEIYKAENIQRIGIEEDDLSVSEFGRFKRNGIEYISIDLLSIRKIKEATEILNISKACKIADAALEETINKLKAGISEIEVYKILQEFIRKKADISFEPIVAFGANSSVPHHKADTTKLKVGDIVLFDLGAKVNDYCSDMTRTLFFRKVSIEQKQIYETVLKSQKAAIALINSSAKKMTGGEADSISREVIKKEGFSDYPHTLGHGIGLEVHEHHFLAPNSQEGFKEGIVFSIEPGIYIPNFGGVRIEDLFVYEKGKLRRLTKSPNKLRVV